ncbi:MAG: 30S ribosomal protein S20 [Bacilli bacterium]|jgi:small subunit ribosomal protein S20|nr:30S ribosomal protein S20 [Bacilli bacterium]
MAQIKSQKKRILTNEKARVANVARRSQMRTAIKACRQAIEAKKYDEANKLLNEAVALIDHACQDGIIKKENAARRKSSLMAAVAAIKPAEKKA